MKLLKILISFMLAAALTACAADTVSESTAAPEAEASVVSSAPSAETTEQVLEYSSQEGEFSSAISACEIYLNGKVRYIESLSPVDFLLKTDGAFVSVFTAEEPMYSSLLADENFVGTSTLADEPTGELETNQAENALVYCDGEHAAFILPYSKAGGYAGHFDQDILDKIAYQEQVEAEDPAEYQRMKDQQDLIPYSAEELDTENVYLVFAIDYTGSGGVSFFVDYTSAEASDS